jgi:hypothetical protein
MQSGHCLRLIVCRSPDRHLPITSVRSAPKLTCWDARSAFAHQICPIGNQADIVGIPIEPLPIKSVRSATKLTLWEARSAFAHQVCPVGRQGGIVGSPIGLCPSNLPDRSARWDCGKPDRRGAGLMYIQRELAVRSQPPMVYDRSRRVSAGEPEVIGLVIGAIHPLS